MYVSIYGVDQRGFRTSRTYSIFTNIFKQANSIARRHGIAVRKKRC